MLEFLADEDLGMNTIQIDIQDPPNLDRPAKQDDDSSREPPSCFSFTSQFPGTLRSSQTSQITSVSSLTSPSAAGKVENSDEEMEESSEDEVMETNVDNTNKTQRAGSESASSALASRHQRGGDQAD